MCFFIFKLIIDNNSLCLTLNLLLKIKLDSSLKLQVKLLTLYSLVFIKKILNMLLLAQGYLSLRF